MGWGSRGSYRQRRTLAPATRTGRATCRSSRPAHLHRNASPSDLLVSGLGPALTGDVLQGLGLRFLRTKRLPGLHPRRGQWLGAEVGISKHFWNLPKGGPSRTPSSVSLPLFPPTFKRLILCAVSLSPFIGDAQRQTAQAGGAPGKGAHSGPRDTLGFDCTAPDQILVEGVR